MDLKRFARSHLRETLINCSTESRDAGLSELLRANDQYAELLAAAESLRAENARLREALAAIVEAETKHGGIVDGHIDLARAALKGAE